VRKYSQRESVVNALLLGKEQRKHYQHPLQDKSGTRVFGTVAVILRNDNFLISIEEVHDPPVRSIDLEEYDVEELYCVPTLIEVEDLLRRRLAIELDELGPAKGYKRF
jgi:hypothetical protein